jgi:serine/threonine protein kinase
MGTLHYASPEQLHDAHGVDPRTDVYGWGATLYYLLTGRAPYWWAKGYPEVVQAVMQDDTPRADRLDAGIPPGLAGVIERAMSREPERRFADAREALEALALLRV